MITSNARLRQLTAWAVVATACLAGGTGCQITVGGQTLPSPYYDQDDVQYMAPGSEFKLSREAAALKRYKAEQALQQGGR